MENTTDNNETYQKALTPKALAYSTTITKWTIPIYQRLFVWQEEQIWQLLDDLYEASKKSQDDYYIGIFTITVDKDEHNWVVVDGQQRLTFLSLFAAWCIRKNILKDEWARFLRNGENSFRIDYFARDEEKKDLQSILENKEIDTLSNANFRAFCNCMVKMENAIINHSETYSRSFEEYANYLFEHTAFLVSLLPKSYDDVDLNRFFERMNVAGRQLTPIDQIRGRYFPAMAGVFDACLNFEKRFQDDKEYSTSVQSSEQSLMDILKSSIEQTADQPDSTAFEPNARAIMKPEIMLLHVLDLTVDNGDKTLILHDSHRILETFKAVFPREESIREEFRKRFLDTLKAYRKWLDEHVIYLDSHDDSIVEYELRKSQNEQDDNHKDYSSPRSKLIQFQSMLYVSSSEWQEWVLKYYRDYAGCSILNAENELEYLKKNERENRRRDFSETMCYPEIDRYWFWLLDYLLWELAVDERLGINLENAKYDSKYVKSIKDAIYEYRFRQNRSIEHLHPQHPQQEMDKWIIDREQSDDSVRNSFGNLAMISSSFNSSQGNDSIGVKFARVKDKQILGDSKLESIKMLLMFLDAHGNDQEWLPELAQEHGNRMFGILKSFLGLNK